MDHYGYFFIYNGVPSNDMGIQVSSRPAISTRNEVVDEYQILGFGTRYKHRGYYDNVEISFNCSYIIHENLWMDKLIELQDLLNGTGELILSDDNDHYYKVLRVQGFEITRFLEKGGTFDVIFECEPYKYSKSGLEWTELQHNIKKTFLNYYNKSFPKIKIVGNGTNIIITINSYGGIELPVTSGEVIIDTERMIITKDGELANNLEKISTTYDGITSLYFDKGINEILVSGSGGTIEIQPNWRS